jgi:hypothetical protein
MNIEYDNKNIRLTSAEIGELYITYVGDTMSKCVMSYFDKIVQDEDIKQIVTFLIAKLDIHIKMMKDIFSSVNHPIPKGFDESDVNINAKRLFSDVFILQYIKHSIKFSLINFGFAVAVTTREDVRKFFNECIDTYQEIASIADGVLLAKGLYIRPPYISTPGMVEFVKDKSYLSGFIAELMEKERPLNALEITHLFTNIQTNALGFALTRGFSLVAESKDVKKYISRGKEIAEKHVRVFCEFLRKDEIPEPMVWDSEVIESKEPPFSDKLMMFHVTTLIGYSIGIYGLAVANSMRSDVGAAFTRLSAEIGQYAKDGAVLMIQNGWLERIPETMNYKELAKS